jgi:PAS domain S-box-containing protein
MPDESARLGSPRALGVLDMPPEERFDRIARLAARVFDVPIVLLSVVGDSGQWLKSAYGLGRSERPWYTWFCEQVLAQGAPVILPDAARDPRPTGEPSACFYAGQPLRAPDGSAIGTLCIVDHQARDFGAADLADLADLAGLAERELLINNQPLFHAGSTTPDAVVAAFIDIAEYKRAEQELRESEERYRNLVDNAQDVIFTLAPDNTITSLNPAFSNSLGWPREGSLGRSFEPLVHPEDLPLALVMVRRALAGETARTLEAFELRIRTRAGQYRHSEFTITPQRKGDAIVGVLGIARDINDRRSSEEALRVSEARNRALINAIPDLMFRLSSAGQYLDFKAERPHDLAVPPDALLGTTIHDALPADVAQHIQLAIDAALQTGAMQTVEYQLVLEQVPRDFEARVVVGGPNEVVSIVRDITDRKNIERMKNEFVSTVSHELRTPLTSIIGSLGLVSGGVVGVLPPNARRLLEIALKNGERLSRLINDILDIEKIESGRMAFGQKVVDLGALVDQAVEANRPYGREFGVTYVLTNDAPGARVEADPDRLIQALTNLLSNAAKFSPPDSAVHVTVRRAGAAMRIEVRDHGRGIPEAFRPRLFQKFAQADASDTRRRGGTGLGLSITKAIVEKLGGSIGYETHVVHGTLFYLDLPEWFEPMGGFR